MTMTSLVYLMTMPSYAYKSQIYENQTEICNILGLFTETIDLWFESFIAKEIRRVIEWLREIKLLTNIVINFF